MIVPKLRFSEFKDEWIESKIGENFNVTSGTTPLRSEQSYFANPSIYWVADSNPKCNVTETRFYLKGRSKT
jgi:hypothetical protein